MARTPEHPTEILINRMAGAISRYQRSASPSLVMTGVAAIGTFLGDWRRDAGVFQMNNRVEAKGRHISAQAVYAYEGAANDGPRLVFRARSQHLPDELLVRGERRKLLGLVERKEEEILAALDRSGPEYKSGRMTYTPLVAVALVRGHETPAHGRRTSISPKDDARIRMELRRDASENLVVVTRGHVGQENPIIPDNVEGVESTPASTQDFPFMFAEIFRLAATPEV